MLEIRLATPQDYDRIAVMTEQEEWNYSRKDFERMDGTGCSRMLVALDESGIIAMITLMDYGEIGWIANFMVDRCCRKRGVGKRLLHEAIRSLGERRTVTLFSTQEAKAFYLREGFKFDRDFYYVRFMGGWRGSAREGEWRDEIAAMDRECFGYSRGEVLKMIAGVGRILYPPRGRGFAMVRPDPREPTLGPVVADDPKEGLKTLYAAFNLLGAGALAVVPNSKIDGVEEVSSVSRLYLGESPPTDYGRVFAFAGLEFG
jgi:GNAT superfamily N-acetyltransferase